MLSSVSADAWDAVQALKGALGAANQQSYGNEQLEYIAKTFGISSGFQPYDLSAAAYYVQPVFSPFRNRIPRLHLQGKNMECKTVVSADSGNASILAAEGALGNAVTTAFADVVTNFKTYKLASDPVTFEALYAAVAKAGDFNVDARAVAAKMLLEAFFVKEERLMLGGVGSQSQITTTNISPDNGFNFTIGGLVGAAPAGGSLTASSSGGTIPASVTVYVKYTAVTPMGIEAGMPTTGGAIPYATSNAGESLPETAELSVAVGTGSTNSVTFTPPAPSSGGAFQWPIVAWKVYVSTASGAEKYYGYTTGAPLAITSIPSTGASVPSSDNSAITSISGGTGSSVEGSFNGILPWLYGLGTGATLYGVNGAISLSNITAQLANAFQSAFADPDAMWANATDINTITNLFVGPNAGLPYWFAASQGQAQGNLTAGFSVTNAMNPVTRKMLPLNVHAYMPQGTLIALTDQLPSWYVGNNVPDVWAWGGSMDYLEIDFQPTANKPLWQSSINCMGALHCFLPSQNIVWYGIS